MITFEVTVARNGGYVLKCDNVIDSESTFVAQSQEDLLDIIKQVLRGEEARMKMEQLAQMEEEGNGI